MEKQIYYFFMIVGAIGTFCGIATDDKNVVISFGVATFLNGVHYLAKKIDELKK